MWDMKPSGALDQQQCGTEPDARGILLKEGFIVQANPDLQFSGFNLQRSGRTALLDARVLHGLSESTSGIP